MTKTFNGYTLKMIAIIGMVMQHAAIILSEITPFWLEIPLWFAGGLTFPIMAFFLVEGYNHTSNLKKYMGRMFIFAVISQIPFATAFAQAHAASGLNIPQLNIIATLLLGLVTLWLYDKMKSRGLFWFVFVIIVLISVLFNWGIIGPIMVILYKTIQTEKTRRTIPSIIAGAYGFLGGLLVLASAALLMMVPATYETAELLETAGGADGIFNMGILSMVFALGNLAVIPLLRRYNGERGRSMKYLFYAVYPLHFVILVGVAYFVGIAELTLRFF
ncbi:MAG: conjugal transfer protein TraX [Oscillospiraceae bacterium]|nr:conjugal transfer protein TraX [Oscillospiraceae bacterium]